MKITEEMLTALAKACYANGVLNGLADSDISFDDSLAQVALNTILDTLEDKDK